MQKSKQQTTFTRTRTLRIQEKMSRRSMHRHLAIAVVRAILLAGVQVLARNVAEPGPGESP